MLTLDVSHLTGCSLLYVHGHVLLVVFWPYGDSVVDPNPCGHPWGEAVVPSASSLSLGDGRITCGVVWSGTGELPNR